VQATPPQGVAGECGRGFPMRRSTVNLAAADAHSRTAGASRIVWSAPSSSRHPAPPRRDARLHATCSPSPRPRRPARRRRRELLRLVVAQRGCFLERRDPRRLLRQPSPPARRSTPCVRAPAHEDILAKVLTSVFVGLDGALNEFEIDIAPGGLPNLRVATSSCTASAIHSWAYRTPRLDRPKLR
jgi:hypothetical protein